MEQPREFDPFMCMWSGAGPAWGPQGGAQARGQGWNTAWLGRFVKAGISLELPWDEWFSNTTHCSGGQELQSKNDWGRVLGSNVSLRVYLGNTPMGAATSGDKGGSERGGHEAYSYLTFLKSYTFFWEHEKKNHAVKILLIILGDSKTPDPSLIKNACSWDCALRAEGLSRVKNPYFPPACCGSLSIFHVVSYLEIWPSKCQEKLNDKVSHLIDCFYVAPNSLQWQSPPGHRLGLRVKKVISSNWEWALVELSQTLPAGKKAWWWVLESAKAPPLKS